MFNKKDKKLEVKEEPKVFTLEDLLKDYKINCCRSYDEIAGALHVLRDAVKFGQIRGIKDSILLNDICFAYVRNEEQSILEFKRWQNREPIDYEISQYRCKNILTIDKLTYVDSNTLKKEKKENLEQQLKLAQEQQKKKVEEIEKLAKELGELE